MKKLLLLALGLLSIAAIEATCPCNKKKRKPFTPYMEKRGRRITPSYAEEIEPVIPEEEQVYRALPIEVEKERPARTVDCAAACNAGGRWVSREVCEQCNNCEGWTTDDQVVQECRDYPN
jgi:hypothetical protein